MWRLVVTVVLWNTITSQPIENQNDITKENGRHPRQLDFVHCCPCPSPDLVGAAPGNDPVDDCPCRRRDADSWGAPSDSVSRAMRPGRPFVNPSDISKEDSKPLLHPEVGLASSMLETLREVTDEEYQDAVARETARNAARFADDDDDMDSTKNVVTIIVNPKEADEENADSLTPEASNTQESRCAHPSGTPQVRDSPSLFELQPNLMQKTLFDMDNGASNVEEKILNLNKGLEGLALKTKPNLLSLFPGKKTNGGNIQSLLKLKNKPLVNNENDLTKNLQSRIPNLSLSSTSRNNESPLKNLGFGTPKFKIPTLRINLGPKSNGIDNNNMDNGVSPSNVQELFSNPSNKENVSPSANPERFSLEKLLKLKDVELIPPKPNKPTITLPKFPLLPTLKINKHGTVHPQVIKKDCLPNKNRFNEEKSQKFQTEILDTIPHASEHQPVSSSSDIGTNVAELPSTEAVVVNTGAKTQILDVLPSASENTVITAGNEKEIESSTPGEKINEFDEESSPISPQILSGDNLDSFSSDENDLDIIIEGDENTDIEAIEILEEIDHPTDEVEIGGTEFDENGQESNLDLIEQEFDINFDDDESTVTENDDSNLGQFVFKSDESDTNNNEIFRENFATTNLQSNSQQQFESKSNDARSMELLYESNLGIQNSENLTVERKLKSNNDILSSIKENVEQRLKNIRNSHNNIFEQLTPIALNTETVNNGVASSRDEHLSVYSQEMITDDSTEVKIQDLQNMSDSLLDLEKKINNNDTHTHSNLNNVNNNTKKETKNFDMASSATTLKEHINNRGKNEIADTEDETGAKNIMSNDNTCFSALKPRGMQDTREALTSLPNDKNEMTSAASESILSKIGEPLGTPLLQQSIVVQPTLFDSSSLIPQIPNLDVINLNLPTLGDLTTGLSSFLEENARSSKDQGAESSEFASAEDCSETEPGMETSASTKKAKSALPALRPLEDISLDIFQMNPLSEGLMSKMPSLNLNSFKTKLSLPQSLELKPLKLESSLGKKNGGVIGASLSFGKPSQKLSSLRRTPIKLTEHPLPNVPTLEELHEAMKANAESLLKSPLVKQIHTPIEDTLRSSLVLGESLKSHTDNTMKNLHKSLSSTLDGAHISSSRSKFAKPQDLLEMVSSAHEDMHDKLHAIQIDLQDRLSSIHDRFIDPSLVPTFQPSLMSKSRIVEPPKETGTWRIAKPKKRPTSNLHNSRTTGATKKATAKKPTERANKLIAKTKETNKLRPLKLSKAASSLNPTTMEVPKLMTTSLKPPFSMPLQRDETVKLRDSKPLFMEEKPKPYHTIHRKPFGEFKVTIESAPRHINTETRPESKSAMQKEPTQFHSMSKLTRPKINNDWQGFASEPKVVQIPSTNLDSEASEFDRNEFPVFTKSSSVYNPKTLLKPAPVKLPLRSPPSISLPKVTESPLLAKMRDSIKIKLSRPAQKVKKLQNMGALAKPSVKDDMSRAASEIKNEVVSITEPMKENVSYKCKMVCVRD